MATTKPTNVAPTTAPTAVPAAPPVGAPAPGPIPAHCQPCPPQFRLDAPLRWKTANPLEQKVLENLQGNILKGHGRDHTTNVFVRFGTDTRKTRRLLRELGNFHVTSAYKQLVATDAFKQGKGDGGVFCALFVSAHGYGALGLNFVAPAGNTIFVAGGMRDPGSLAKLGDPAPADWENHFDKTIDAMVLVADDDPAHSAVRVAQIEALVAEAGGHVVHKQAGKAVRNSVGNGLEHFGYVDGRSQPLMLMEDIETESREEGIAHWDPTASLDKALVADPLANDPDNLSFGSFFIFRKLEQKVRDFKTQEQVLADALGLAGEDRERAGALVVGRFEDGTPVTLSDEARGIAAPRNDFSYAGDAAGSRCPFHAHIRKTNPRGSGGFGQTLQAEQSHIMPRRGITYEDTPRATHPDALPEADSKAEFDSKVKHLLPSGGLGLLFMAYNARLDDQFVFTQQSWANSTGFPQAPTPPGVDGVIAQSTAPGQQRYPKGWDDPAAGHADFDFRGFVRMRGGEYFYAPSLRFLRNL
jgi:Dyp-type peroxidase family